MNKSVGPLKSSETTPLGVDFRGADLSWEEVAGKWQLVPLSEAGEAFACLLDKESTTQRLSRDVKSLGDAYVHGWVRDVRGWCQRPLALWPAYRPGLGRWTAYLVQCRRCPGCRKSRQSDWASRAGLEMAVASRTWLLTLTLGAKARRAYQRAVAAGLPEQHHAHLTRLLDRLRHSHGVRYLLVEERHKDGTPHWHALLHEGRRRLRYRELRTQWEAGFLHAVVIDRDNSAEAAVYVAKYVAKNPGRRVRASRAYGKLGLRQSRPSGQAEAGQPQGG